ncbi:MAG: hypothetical protein AB8B80_04955 [Marinicellaceae bacterium]
MRTVSRIVVISLLLLSALICYGLGLQKGVVFFVVIGVIFEGLFWAGLFRLDKKSKKQK